MFLHKKATTKSTKGFSLKVKGGQKGRIRKNIFICLFSVMICEGIFQEILLPSSGNANDYVAHIETKQADLNKNNRTCGPG